MNELRPQLEALASKFIAGLLDAMSSGSLAELADASAPRSSAAVAAGRRVVLSKPAWGPSPARTRANGARRKRASPAEVEQQKALALATAKALKPAFSKGDVMKKSGSRIDLGRALALLVAAGKLTKKGDRRKTRYWVK